MAASRPVVATTSRWKGCTNRRRPSTEAHRQVGPGLLQQGGQQVEADLVGAGLGWGVAERGVEGGGAGTQEGGAQARAYKHAMSRRGKETEGSRPSSAAAAACHSLALLYAPRSPPGCAHPPSAG